MKVALLALTYANMGNQFVLQPVVGLMMGELYGLYSATAISWIVTVSSLALGVTCVFAGKFGLVIGRKRLLLVGSLLFCFGGISTGIFSGNLIAMYVSRIFVGIGAGCVCTMSTVLIAVCFPEPSECNKMMGTYGYLNAISGLFFSLAAGFLGGYSWQTACWLYLGGAVMFVIQAVGIPSDREIAERSAARAIGGDGDIADTFDVEQRLGQVKIAAPMAEIIIMTLIITSVGNLYPLNVSNLIVEYGLGSAQQAGTVLAFNSVGGFFSCLFFYRIYARIGEVVPVITSSAALCAALSAAFWRSLAGIAFGAACYGVMIGMYFAYVLARTARVSKPQYLDTNMSFANASNYIGMSLASPLMVLIATVFGSSLYRYDYLFMAIAFVLIVTYYVVRNTRLGHSNAATDAL